MRPRALVLQAAAWAALLLFPYGCGGDAPAPSPTAQPRSAAEGASTDRASRGRDERGPARVPEAERRPIDPASAGSLRGVALFEGEPPERKPLPLSGAAGCHIEDGKPPLSERVVVADGRLANVFVHIAEGLERWLPPPPPEEPVVLDQKGCTYVPHVAGIRVGQTLRVLNSDGGTHNVHTRGRRNESFNRSQPPGTALEHVFERREVMVPVVCDIHPWMRSFLGVVEHPFFAVTAADGTFEIAGLPPGTYTLAVWHEAYGEREVELAVEAGAETPVELVFP